jgi:hypothetical protein
MLGCGGWTSFGNFPNRHNMPHKQKHLLPVCLAWLLNVFYVNQGNGWKFPTFHNTMNIVSDMCKYGKPKEANTEVGECHHKGFAKCIGR